MLDQAATTGGMMGYDDDDDDTEKLLNWDAVGRGYDILRVDPLDVATGAKYGVAFAFDKFDQTQDGRARKPTVTEHKSAAGGGYDRQVTEITSSYAFQALLHAEGSVNVSDPTGALFSSSLSASYEQTHRDTVTHESVVTYASEKVSLYRLRIRSKDPDLRLSDDLAKAVAALPSTDGPAYDQLLEDFGTHYAKEVLFGGRASQRIVVSRADYENFLEQGLDVGAEVSATFEIAKAGAKGNVADKRSRQFAGARGVTVENIVYSGGTPQESFDMWSMYVKEAPAAIEVDLEPLHTLLTAAFCEDDADIAAKQDALKTATDRYLRTNGTDPSRSVLKIGDTVSLSLIGRDPPRYLSAPASLNRVTTVDGDPGSDGSWVLVDLQDAAASSQLEHRRDVAIKLATQPRFLDAQAGADDTYDPGDGLVAAVPTSPGTTSAQWTVELVTATDVSKISDGDYVRFRSRWNAPGEDRGYLFAEAPSDSDRRVFAFGRQQHSGTLWRLTRAEA